MASFCGDGAELLSSITMGNSSISRRTVHGIQEVNCFEQFRIGPGAGFCGNYDELVGCVAENFLTI
jgi:hypothetical protein